ncbi:FAD-binding domain-containing protein [Serendipita vermifera]|nr:FAD-binding domain-containing protein [Serendipita vermifera]
MSSSAMSDTRTIDIKGVLIRAGFTGDLVTSTDPDYHDSLVRFAKNSQRNAALIAFVKSVQEVVQVINLASTRSIPVVVRCGGHSAYGSSTEDGIVVDLSRYMKNVRVHEENKLAYVEGGATWKDVDEATIKHGLAAVGGTINHVGVGGLSLIGGYGWLMGEHGMVIDNLVQATIVMADGSFHTVNEETEPDLFWAIRGAGANFGCVTEFVFRLHPQRSTVYAGPLIFSPSQIIPVVTAVEGWYRDASEKEGVFLVATSRGPSGNPSIIVVLFFNGDEEEGKKRFKKILDVGPVANLAGTIPYTQLNSMQNQAAKFGINHLTTGITRANLPSSIASAIFDQTLKLAKVPSSFKSINPTTGAEETNTIVLTVIWQYYHLKKHSTVAPDAMAFRMRLQHPQGMLNATWTADGEGATAEAEERMITLKTICDTALHPTFGDLGPSVEDTGYGGMEVSDSRTTEGAKVIYAGNYSRLQEIKAKYDPHKMFSSWYPIEPTSTI